MNASMNSLGHPELLVLESSRYPYFYIEIITAILNEQLSPNKTVCKPIFTLNIHWSLSNYFHMDWMSIMILCDYKSDFALRVSISTQCLINFCVPLIHILYAWFWQVYCYLLPQAFRTLGLISCCMVSFCMPPNSLKNAPKLNLNGEDVC